jgi:N6-adenosine-specific RNA methylase IME4
MSQQQLLDLPIPKWLEDDAHVYLWTLDGELRNAFALFDHWGIECKQMLAWNKTYPSGIPRMGLGYHFRSNVEYVLFGVRGRLRTREAARAIGKAFEAPVVGEHSEKPNRFYEIVRAASYPPFGELFGRKPRVGFTNLYQEAAKDIIKAAA